MQQEKTSLRCDRHPNFIVDLQSGTTFETFFGQKHLNVVEKFGLVCRRQRHKERNSALNNLQPLVRKRPRFNRLSMSFFQEAEHVGGSKRSLSALSFRPKWRNL